MRGFPRRDKGCQHRDCHHDPRRDLEQSPAGHRSWSSAFPMEGLPTQKPAENDDPFRRGIHPPTSPPRITGTSMNNSQGLRCASVPSATAAAWSWLRCGQPTDRQQSRSASGGDKSHRQVARCAGGGRNQQDVLARRRRSVWIARRRGTSAGGTPPLESLHAPYGGAPPASKTGTATPGSIARYIKDVPL